MNFLNLVRFLFLLYFCKFNDAGQKLITLAHPKKPKKIVFTCTGFGIEQSKSR